MDGGFTKKKCQKSMSCCRFHYRVGAFSSDNIRYHLKQYALKNVSVRTGENKPKRNRIRGEICFVFVHTNTFLFTVVIVNSGGRSLIYYQVVFYSCHRFEEECQKSTNIFN